MSPGAAGPSAMWSGPKKRGAAVCRRARSGRALRLWDEVRGQQNRAWGHGRDERDGRVLLLPPAVRGGPHARAHDAASARQRSAAPGRGQASALWLAREEGEAHV